MGIYHILIALFIILSSDYSMYCQTKAPVTIRTAYKGKFYKNPTRASVENIKPVTGIPVFNNPDSTIPMPVELDYFNADITGRNIRLNWETSVEINNYGFKIEREISGSSTAGLLNNWKEIGFVKGNGDSNSKKNYSFIDYDPAGGIFYKYRLKQIDNQGNCTYSKAVVINITPSGFTLSRNYPNPFNPATSIDYSLPYESKVIIKLYNIIGEEVATLVNTIQSAGKYSVRFNAGLYKNIASGTYIYRMEAGKFVSARKLILMK